MRQEMTRRDLIEAATAAGATALIAGSALRPALAQATDTKQEKIVKTNVSFDSNGFRIAGHLYLPESLGAGHHPAVVVSHPASGVKEQTAGLYAGKLAEQGFIALAFDAAYNGESTGEPRGLEDPAQRVEDIKNAITFMSLRDEVDADRIFLLGVCASGGYVIPATVTDHRIKAVAGVSPAEIGRFFRNGYDGRQDPSVIKGMLDNAAKARTAQGRGEGFQSFPIFPANAEEARKLGPYVYEGWEYYCTDRAQNPRSAKEMPWMSIDKIAGFDGFRFIDMVAPRPLLMIVGTEADTKWQAEEAFPRAGGPKELYWIDGATHVGLYDKPQWVTPAIAKLTEFYRANLRV